MGRRQKARRLVAPQQSQRRLKKGVEASKCCGNYVRTNLAFNGGRQAICEHCGSFNTFRATVGIQISYWAGMLVFGLWAAAQLVSLGSINLIAILICAFFVNGVIATFKRPNGSLQKGFMDPALAAQYNKSKRRSNLVSRTVLISVGAGVVIVAIYMNTLY